MQGRRSENWRAKAGFGDTPLALVRSRRASSWLEVMGRKPIVLDFLPRRGGRPASLLEVTVDVEEKEVLEGAEFSSDVLDVLDSLRRLAAAGFMMA